MTRYPIAKPVIGRAEAQAVLDVLRSGVLALGPRQDAFERAFAQMVGTQHAVAVSSGTAGLHVALLAAGIGPGDEVITTPLSFIASANAILYVGATPVFVDIDPVTLNIDPARVQAAITPRTKAILPVHIFGQAADMTVLTRIAREHKLTIIEDACEAIAAQHRGESVGTFGQSAVFAFYPNKQITTGEGGMVVTNDTRVAEQCRSLANQGRAPNLQWLDHQQLGYNYRMDEMSAALGTVQLKRLPSLIRARRRIAAWYDQELARVLPSVRRPQTASGNTHTYFVYVVQTAAHGAHRDALIRDLDTRGVQTKPYLPCIHLFSFYRDRFGYAPGAFPIAEKISDASIALPFYPTLTQHDISVIVARLAQALRPYDASL